MNANTELTIQYRDADNYKASYPLILSGHFTQALWTRLQAALHDGECLVPHQLGLTNPAFQLAIYDSFPSEETDHGWCEITEADHDFDDIMSLCLTSAPAGSHYSVQTFVEACEGIEWDAEGEFLRIMEDAA